MRSSLLSLLLATAFIPAAAQAGDDQADASRSRAERPSQDNDTKASRPQRQERAPRTERAPRVERADVRNEKAEPSVERGKDSRASGSDARIERQEQVQRAGRQDRPERPTPADQQVPDSEPVAQSTTHSAVQPAQGAQGQPDSLLEGFRRVARDENSRTGDGHHDGHERDKDHDWSRDWRKDHRYDWWDYRNRYRSVYRLGRYRDPYGWGYRRWSIGYSLWPSHYSSGFWLNDPWMYRLPPAYGPFRWVRYYDDALLVNIYTGNVIDVVYNFFL